MKIIRFLLIIVVIFCTFSLNVSAEERTDEYISKFEEILPDEYRGITDDTGALLQTVGIRELLSEIIAAVKGEGGEILGFFLTLIGFCAVFAVADTVASSFSGAISVCVGLILSLSLFSTLGEIYLSVGDSLSKISNFFSLLLPIATGMTALGGGSLSASVGASGMYFTLAVLDGVGGKILLSIIGFGFCTSLLSAFDNVSVSSVGRGVKALFFWLFGIFTTVLMGTLALQSMISAAADSAAMRAARYMASGMIPIVGSAVSGALSTLAGGLSYAKVTVGTGAVSVIVGIALSPLVMLLLYRLCLSLSVIIADFLGVSAASRVFTSFRLSLDTMIALYTLSVIIYIFEIILFIKSGVALL